MEQQTITVEITVTAPLSKVWEFWNEPEHVIKWNFASDDWQCPSATNDLRVGGKFTSRMEAKDGNTGFDFGGTYTEVVPEQYISYVMDGGDARKVDVVFKQEGENVKVTETFEAETENTLEMQRSGWQAILDNFKKYVEAA
jgi:uncharacterized protein YndB with AHSA1/START domain